MILIATDRDSAAAVLRVQFSLDHADAALIAEFAEAEGQHHIPGGEGRRIVFDHGSWYITRKD